MSLSLKLHLINTNTLNKAETDTALIGHPALRSPSLGFSCDDEHSKPLFQKKVSLSWSCVIGQNLLVDSFQSPFLITQYHQPLALFIPWS
jgi:hypothetical protein